MNFAGVLSVHLRHLILNLVVDGTCRRHLTVCYNFRKKHTKTFITLYWLHFIIMFDIIVRGLLHNQHVYLSRFLWSSLFWLLSIKHVIRVLRLMHGLKFKVCVSRYWHVLYTPSPQTTKIILFTKASEKIKIVFAYEWYYAWADRISVTFSHFHDLTRVFSPHE